MDPSELKIVPDFILEEKSCLTCLKYLTISPISVHPGGSTKCGRCSKSHRPPTSFVLLENLGNIGDNCIPLTLLGYASSQDYLFPCVNRFEGCPAALPYLDLRQHEERCLAEVRECFLCNFSGVGSQLVEHFKRDHKRNFLTQRTNLCFEVNKNLNQKYLYRSPRSLFIVHIRIKGDLKLFEAKIQYLGSSRLSKVKIKCSFQFYTTLKNKYTNLQTEPFVISNNFANLNFRLSDSKMIDLKVLLLKVVIVESEPSE